jgi:hypothetical protein
MLVLSLASVSLTACGTGNQGAAEQEKNESETAEKKTQEVQSTQQDFEGASAQASETAEASETDEAGETEEPGETAEASETDEAGETEEPGETAAEGYSLKDLSNYSFEFCSGAGGWSTDFEIEEDGSFCGTYHDSEMGSFGDGYENGTMYYSSFSGHFSELTQVDAYTYEMTLLDISYENELDTEEIIDNIKYCYTDAYGLTGTTKFLVYVPGTPVSTFDEEIYFWIRWSVGEDTDKLERPVIVNVDQEEGIYSYDRTAE